MRRFLKGCFAILLLSASMPCAADTETLSIIANGENVGHVIAETVGNHISVDFKIDNNGRGPKHTEELILNDKGLPVFWSIKGTSLMGGPVEERFDWKNGIARWTSQADEGMLKTKTVPLYIVNDDSPWALWVYAKAALAETNHTINVLPAGKVSLTKLQTISLGQKSAEISVTLYSLAGVQLSPSYLALDMNGDLFATFSGEQGTAIRKGYEAEVPQLIKRIDSLDTARVEGLHHQLAHKFDTPVRIHNVRIFEPRSGKLSSLSTVVIMRDKITQVLPEDSLEGSEDEVVINGEGGTLYAGLHDMHSHATLQSGLFYLAAGVTATRDMGNNNAFLQDLLDKIKADKVSWPRIVPNGFIEGTSPYSAQFGFVASTLDEALKDVRWYADRGYFEIKLYNSIKPEWVKPISDIAHSLGMGLTGHVPAFSTPDRVIRDGYDTIAHINQLMLGWILDEGEDTRTPLRLTAMSRAGNLDLTSERVQQTVRLMKDHHTAIGTTAVTLEQLMMSRAKEVPSFAADYFEHLPIGFQRYRKRSYVSFDSPQVDKAYRDGFAKILETIGMLHREGITILPGTDDETGFTVLRELELYVMAGMSPAEALRIGTLDMEKYLGRDNLLGSIEQGKLADFVLVAGDPTKDITAIKRPRMVVKGGDIYFPTEIYEALGITPFTVPPTFKLPAQQHTETAK